MDRMLQAKSILTPVKAPGWWFGARLNMNLYRGCEHHCIYCDSRSACYGNEHFDDDLQVKANAIPLLDAELSRKRQQTIISTGAMSDPYTWSERRYGLTRQALELIARYHFGVHITTKSDLVLRDVALLQEIGRRHTSVCLTITTTDDALARLVEPGAPPPSARLTALAQLAEAGVITGISMMPLLPYIEDTPENVRAIVEAAQQCGVRYIEGWFGMSLRDGSREHYYTQLDQHFPGLRQRYERRYRNAYSCPSDHEQALSQLFHDLCRQYHIGARFPVGAEVVLPEEQLSLF